MRHTVVSKIIQIASYRRKPVSRAPTNGIPAGACPPRRRGAGMTRGVAALLIALSLSGCAGGIKKEASYPTRPDGTDKIVYSDQKHETVWGEDDSLGKRLFGQEDDKNGGTTGIGVNSFLWRAALDTISFMPVASADPFGGVILTDWYENPETPGQRFKINVYILDKQLRADGLRVTIFKQTQDKKGWRDAKVPEDMVANIENTILTRARELRVAQLGTRKN